MKRIPTRGSVLTFALFLCSFFCAASTVRANTAESVGMAGTVTAVSEGVEGARSNPANLGFRTNPGLQIELISGSALIGNNGVDLDLYNQMMGETLSMQDKQDILQAIPAGGLSAEAHASASVLGVQFGRLALTVNGRGDGYSNLPHDMFELLLMGNAVADSLNFESAEGEAYSVGAVQLSGAATLMHHPYGPVHFGVGMSYLQGLGYARLDRMEGQLVTSTTGIHGRAEGQLTTATTGAGFGLDLGVSTEIGRRYRASLALRNAFAQVNYNQNIEQRTFVAQLDSFDVATLDEIENAEDLFSSSDEVVEGQPFTITLPRSLHLGVARITPRTRVGLEYEQGFGQSARGTTTPRTAVGAEWKALSWLPLRAGLSVGGRSSRMASAGFGIHILAFHLDFAASTVGEWIPGSPKGISLAMGTGLRF